VLLYIVHKTQDPVAIRRGQNRTGTEAKTRDGRDTMGLVVAEVSSGEMAPATTRTREKYMIGSI